MDSETTYPNNLDFGIADIFIDYDYVSDTTSLIFVRNANDANDVRIRITTCEAMQLIYSGIRLTIDNFA